MADLTEIGQVKSIFSYLIENFLHLDCYLNYFPLHFLSDVGEFAAAAAAFLIAFYCTKP